MKNISNEVKKEKAAISKPKIVDIQTAIKMVSDKYQIPKDKIANILLANKMLESSEGRGNE